MARASAASKAPEGQRIYGGITGELRREGRRARLVAAGIVCFGRDAFAATTTRSIAAESGLTPSRRRAGKWTRVYARGHRTSSPN